MKSYYERVQGPLIVDEPVALHCVVATHVEVTERGELHVYGFIGGDLRVRPGGRAVIHGRVAGTLFNEGNCEVRGLVARHLCLPGGTTTTVGEGAVIRHEEDHRCLGLM